MQWIGVGFLFILGYVWLAQRIGIGALALTLWLVFIGFVIIVWAIIRQDLLPYLSNLREIRDYDRQVALQRHEMELAAQAERDKELQYLAAQQQAKLDEAARKAMTLAAITVDSHGISSIAKQLVDRHRNTRP